MITLTPRLVRILPFALALSLTAGCATTSESGAPAGVSPVQVRILAINDFHGNLEVPPGEVTYRAKGQSETARLGGAARLGATMARLREGVPHTISVAAGDMVGASPLASAYFLDEPSVVALSRMQLDLVAVGNHEFDRGTAELQRLQDGGCEAFTDRQPCRLDPFPGAGFQFLAANVVDQTGETLFPGSAMREFGEAKIGFIGMTLKETGTLTAQAGTAGYSFANEAVTANAMAAELREQGADAIVLLLHQGGRVDPYFNVDGCPGLEGGILPILERLSPEIGVVVSGHTHSAYVCELRASDGSARLLTSAGRYGYFVTAIDLTVDPEGGHILASRAINQPVVGGAGEQPDVAELVRRYSAASEHIAARRVGRIEGSLIPAENELDTPLARLVADAQLAATRDPAHGDAQIAFINSGGLRTAFEPAADGTVTYGQIFALQPFGNTLEVLELTGEQLRALLEQQFADDDSGKIRQSLLIPSTGFSYSFDATAAAGKRIVEMRLDGQPIEAERRYRITTNNFLASGGDGFSVFTQGRYLAHGGIDLDALESFIAAGAQASRIPRVMPAGTPGP